MHSPANERRVHYTVDWLRGARLHSPAQNGGNGGKTAQNSSRHTAMSQRKRAQWWCCWRDGTTLRKLIITLARAVIRVRCCWLFNPTSLEFREWVWNASEERGGLCGKKMEAKRTYKHTHTRAHRLAAWVEAMGEERRRRMVSGWDGNGAWCGAVFLCFFLSVW